MALAFRDLEKKAFAGFREKWQWLLYSDMDGSTRIRSKMVEAMYENASVGHCVISCQMFFKSEFPLDSALVCDSD